MKTVILGGTFNPIHLGHLLLAEEALLQEGFDRVLFIPTNKPAHKVVDGTTVEDRLTMLRRALKALPWNNVILETCELAREGISYSIDTVRYVWDHYALDEPPSLILGDDLFETFHTWKDAEELSQKARLLVAHRKYDETLVSVWPHRYLNNKRIDVSSSEIRQRVHDGLAWRALVPESVAGYIDAHRLYRDGNDQ